MGKKEEEIKQYYITKSIQLIKKINTINTSKKINLSYVLSLLEVGNVEYAMQNYSYFKMVYMNITNTFTGIYDEELEEFKVREC